jgi:hypothetical protein
LRLQQSNVDILDEFGVFLNELEAGLGVFTHQAFDEIVDLIRCLRCSSGFCAFQFDGDSMSAAASGNLTRMQRARWQDSSSFL